MEKILELCIKFLIFVCHSEKALQFDYELPQKCYELLIYHLKPALLCLPTSISQNMDNLSLFSECAEFQGALQIINTIIKIIPQGLERTGKVLVVEFCNSMCNFAKILVTTDIWNFLSTFQACLIYGQKNSTIACITVVSSLRKLLKNDENPERISNFIFDDTQNPTTLSLLEQILIETASPDLCTEIMQLFIALKSSEQGSKLVLQKRLAVYASKFSSRNPLLESMTSGLIDALEDDYNLTLVKVLKVMKASESTMKRIYDNISRSRPLEIAELAEIVEKCPNDHTNTALSAAQLIQVIAGEGVTLDVGKELKAFTSALRLSMTNEAVFCCLLSYITNVKSITEAFSLRQNNIYKVKLIEILLSAFETMQCSFVLKQIMNAVALLKKCCTEGLWDHLETMSKSLYEELVLAEVNKIKQTDTPALSHMNSLIKLNILMDLGFLNQLGTSENEAMFIVTLNCDDDHPMFPFFIRYRTTLIKKFWQDVLKDADDNHLDDALVVLRKLSGHILKSIQQVLDALSREGYQMLDASTLISSLLELLICFNINPKSIKHEGLLKLLYTNQYDLKTEQFKKIIDFIEEYAFPSKKLYGSSSDEMCNIEYQKIMIFRLSEMIKVFKFLPNISHLSKIIRHFHENSEFHADLELLLKCVINRQSCFGAVVGQAIIGLFKDKSGLKPFLKAVDCLLSKVFNTKKVSITHYKSLVIDYIIDKVNLPEIFNM
jgi:DNA-directed RNA polymerase subunit F